MGIKIYWRQGGQRPLYMILNVDVSRYYVLSYYTWHMAYYAFPPLNSLDDTVIYLISVVKFSDGTLM